ncbi:MAG TPA: T9SS type A sorting domain-containing protein, partial [Crocinitomicaceae bacterium]|nr:T9SS type A sorting domain-containing protein [Crocinitomicaceae bacterium]
VYEPRDAQKGNAARAIMYMVVTYGFNLNGDPAATNQDQELLKTWHYADLPDDYEIARHEYIYNLQGNRNPFIDSVEFACHIDFDNLLYLGPDCSVLNTIELSENSVSVYPIPATSYITISADEQITSIKMIDMQGRTVLTDANVSLSKLNLDVSSVQSGSYIIRVTTVKGSIQRKVIIE